MSMFRIFAAVSFALTLVALGGCETTTARGAVGADRSQLMLVSSQQLEQMAAQSYVKLGSDAARKGALNRDGAMLQRVRAVASRIEPQTAVFRRDAPARERNGPITGEGRYRAGTTGAGQGGKPRHRLQSCAFAPEFSVR